MFHNAGRTATLLWNEALQIDADLLTPCSVEVLGSLQAVSHTTIVDLDHAKYTPCSRDRVQIQTYLHMYVACPANIQPWHAHPRRTHGKEASKPPSRQTPARRKPPTVKRTTVVIRMPTSAHRQRPSSRPRFTTTSASVPSCLQRHGAARGGVHCYHLCPRCCMHLCQGRRCCSRPRPGARGLHARVVSLLQSDGD